jgi:hypothetical protein
MIAVDSFEGAVARIEPDRLLSVQPVPQAFDGIATGGFIAGMEDAGPVI